METKMSTVQSVSRLIRWLGLILMVMSFAATVQAAGITSTKHNLSTTGTGNNKLSAGTDQICVFCHTPHGSDTSAAVPLWNKKLPSTTYAVYNSVAASATSTIDGQILTVGSVSLACLSCHDGTQAMDNMMNAPGSGGYNAAGAIPAGWTWTGSSTMPAGITNIGADLKNDHPIGIQYCGGGLSANGTGSVTGTCADGDFISPANAVTSDGRSATVSSASINNGNVFWIDLPAADGTAKDGKRGKQDIALYTRDFTGAAGTPSVECGSCHDPHVEAKASDGISFMRVTTAGSKICLSCHVK
jgi:Doubled CXXCH motif (Paired_CXXCH_1)